MSSSHCRCCGSINHSAVNDRWSVCHSCGVYINRYPPESDHGSIDLQMPLVMRDILKFAPIVRLLQKNGLRGEIYDVCTGPGYMQFCAQVMGVHAYGNDSNPTAVSLAKDVFNVLLQHGEFEDLVLPQGIGAFISHHGIEHVRQPRLALEKMVNALPSGGLIYLAHPVMRDTQWVARMGSGGHQHEWTFDAFASLLDQFYPGLKTLGSGHNQFTEWVDAGQWWLLRRV